MSSYRSPSLAVSGACPAPESSVDAGVPWHFGDPHTEQAQLVRGEGAVDLSHRSVVRVNGPDRLSWLHTITSQQLDRLVAGESTTSLVLSPHGHVEQELHVIEDGHATWLILESTSVPALLTYLQAMRFMLRVEIEDVTADYAVVGELHREVNPNYPTWLSPAAFGQSEPSDPVAAGYVPHRDQTWAVREVVLPRAELAGYLQQAGPRAGTWAWEALRIAAGVPRLGFETDHRTIPHEVGWVPTAVHLQKGCYRGQETVARVHNLGRPPRRLVVLNLDGSDGRDPAVGDPVEYDGRTVGRVTSVARHYELGPVALAVVKRSVPADALLTAAGVAATQDIVVTP